MQSSRIIQSTIIISLIRGWNDSTLFSYNDWVKDILRKLSVVQWIVIVLAIIIDVFIIVNSCLPAGPSTSESNWLVIPIKNLINLVKPNTINDGNIGYLSAFVRKFIGHFSLFMVSGFLNTLSFKFVYFNATQKYWKFIIISCITGLFLAFLTEFIQKFVPGRSGEITDVLIDFSGYLIGVLVIGLITYIKRNKRTILENEN